MCKRENGNYNFHVKFESNLKWIICKCCGRRSRATNMKLSWNWYTTPDSRWLNCHISHSQSEISKNVSKSLSWQKFEIFFLFFSSRFPLVGRTEWFSWKFHWILIFFWNFWISSWKIFQFSIRCSLCGIAQQHKKKVGREKINEFVHSSCAAAVNSQSTEFELSTRENPKRTRTNVAAAKS